VFFLVFVFGRFGGCSSSLRCSVAWVILFSCVVLGKGAYVFVWLALLLSNCDFLSQMKRSRTFAGFLSEKGKKVVVEAELVWTTIDGVNSITGDALDKEGGE
jgi:hypothetical protein